MIWLLIIHGLMGPAVMGHFDDEETCKKAGVQFMALLKEEQRTPPKKIGCAGFLARETPNEHREAQNDIARTA